MYKIIAVAAFVTSAALALPVSALAGATPAPAAAHAELLDKYSDDDIHNLMAYLQTLR